MANRKSAASGKSVKKDQPVQVDQDRKKESASASAKKRIFKVSTFHH